MTGIKIMTVLKERGYKYALPRYFPKIKDAFFYQRTKGNVVIAQFLYKAILRRVPVLTGNLKNNINLEVSSTGDAIISISGRTPYAAFQELGYTPHYIPVSWIYDHLAVPGTSRPVTTQKFAFVSEYTPFIRPSYMSLKKNYNRIWSRNWYKSMIRGGKVYKVYTLP